MILIQNKKKQKDVVDVKEPRRENLRQQQQKRKPSWVMRRHVGWIQFKLAALLALD